MATLSSVLVKTTCVGVDVGVPNILCEVYVLDVDAAKDDGAFSLVAVEG